MSAAVGPICTEPIKSASTKRIDEGKVGLHPEKVGVKKVGVLKRWESVQQVGWTMHQYKMEVRTALEARADHPTLVLGKTSMRVPSKL